MNRCIPLLVALLAGCAHQSQKTVTETTTTTTTVRTTADPATVTPKTGSNRCYVLLHDAPLVEAHPQRHLALLPNSRDVAPDDVYITTLPAGTRFRVTDIRDYS